MNAKHEGPRNLTVTTRPRQVRVAYLIDVAELPRELLDAVMATCAHVWGGRLSPIVPVSEGRISEAYWQLLKRVDPDRVYSYTTVIQETADRIANEIAPLSLKKHPQHLTDDDRKLYSPSITHELVKIHPLLGFSTEEQWFRSPALVTHKGYEQPDLLVARNFGFFGTMYFLTKSQRTFSN